MTYLLFIVILGTLLSVAIYDKKGFNLLRILVCSILVFIVLNCWLIIPAIFLVILIIVGIVLFKKSMNDDVGEE